MRPRSGAVRASVCGSTARRVTAAATGPGAGTAGTSVAIAAMTASRAVRDSSWSRRSSGVAMSVSVVPQPARLGDTPYVFGEDLEGGERRGRGRAGAVPAVHQGVQRRVGQAEAYVQIPAGTMVLDRVIGGFPGGLAGQRHRSQRRTRPADHRAAAGARPLRADRRRSQAHPLHQPHGLEPVLPLRSDARPRRDRGGAPGVRGPVHRTAQRLLRLLGRDAAGPRAPDGRTGRTGGRTGRLERPTPTSPRRRRSRSPARASTGRHPRSPAPRRSTWPTSRRSPRGSRAAKSARWSSPTPTTAPACSPVVCPRRAPTCSSACSPRAGRDSSRRSTPRWAACSADPPRPWRTS